MRYLREGVAHVGLTPARFQVLQVLSVEGSVSMVELADRLSVTKRNITTLVDGLEKDGLALRQPHPTDRRSKLVSLTDSGRSRFADAAQVQRAHLEALLNQLDPAQQTALAQGLSQLTDALATRSKSEPP